MREIKFRMWNGQYMIHSEYGTWVSFDGVIYKEADKTYNTPNIEIEKDKSKPVLMQFTGLKDKSGVNICEGDIVKVGNAGLGKIVWCELDATFKVYWISPVWVNTRGNEGELIFRNHEITFEVIGNIHQNPELLS